MAGTPGTRAYTLHLEITDADRICGRLSDLSGRGSEFLGWLGLASAIEALTDADPAPAPDPTHSNHLGG